MSSFKKRPRSNGSVVYAPLPELSPFRKGYAGTKRRALSRGGVADIHCFASVMLGMWGIPVSSNVKLTPKWQRHIIHAKF